MVLFCVSLLTGVGAADAQSSPPSQVTVAPPPPAPLDAVSGNPAATTYSVGTGYLGHLLGLKDEWGIKLGGLWLADANLVAAGGVQPGDGHRTARCSAVSP